MIEIYQPNLNNIEKKLLIKSFKKNHISSYGINTKIFENIFSRKYNFKNNFVVNSGTSALQIALLASGVSKNDLVITQSYSFAATSNAILNCGAKPWFFDISKDNFSLNLDQLETILKKKTYIKNNELFHKKTNQKISAILPVFSIGILIDVKRIKKIAKKYKIEVIFDAAAAHGCINFFKKNLNDSFFCFSFNGNKTLTSGSGGIICNDKSNKNKKIMKLINVGKGKKKYRYDLSGYNFRPSNLLSAIGIGQVSRINEILKKKNKIFKFYSSNLDNSKFLKQYCKEDTIPWLYFILLKKNISSKFFQHIKNKKINLDYFWSPLNLNKPYKNYLCENLSNTNYIWRKILILPSHTNLNKKKLDYIKKQIVEALKFYKLI